MTAVLLVSWRHRFERVAGTPLYQLPKSVELVAGEGGPRVACFDFPGISRASFLRVKFSLRCEGLERGQEKWQDGRIVMEWDVREELDQFGSMSKTDSARERELVLRPAGEAAVPRLRVENLGRSGKLILEAFEAEVLTETAWWKMARITLALAWVMWAAIWVCPPIHQGWLRSLAVGVGSFVMVTFVVVPGPWKFVPPLIMPLHVGHAGPRTTVQMMKPQVMPGDQAASLAAVGEIPEGGDLILRIKHHAEALRPVLHGLLLMAPTLAAACAVGRLRAIKLMVLISLLIELAQIAFGFGFDARDLFDLFNDSVGITLGILLHHLLIRKSPRAFRSWMAC